MLEPTILLLEAHKARVNNNKAGVNDNKTGVNNNNTDGTLT